MFTKYDRLEKHENVRKSSLYTYFISLLTGYDLITKRIEFLKIFPNG